MTMSMSTTKFKSCFVPYCTNTTVKTPNKKFLAVPANENRKRTWFEAVRRTYTTSSTSYYCCEDHFDLKEDMENYLMFNLMGGKMILKKNIVPHVFNWPGSSSSKKRKLDDVLSESEIVKNKDISYVPETFDIGTQCDSEKVSVSQQGTQTMKIVQVACNVKPSKLNVKVDTSGLILKKEIATSPLKNKRNKRIKIEETSSEEVFEPSGSDFVPQSDSSEIKMNEQTIIPNIVTFIEKNPKRYIGVPKVWYQILIKHLCEKGNLKKNHVLLCLMKIKLNDTFARLADQFSVSVGGASQIFKKNIYKIDYYLKTFIFWPEKNEIKKNLPIPFRAKYNEVQSIIDCLEIQIERPNNPVKQALTWSQYKKSNTVKYLLSCTPDGFINFISSGYGGRISDTMLTKSCEYLNVLPHNSMVMADRGFKEIDNLLRNKSCTLLRPPSVSSSLKPTKEEVMETKRIASLRIHVERVIRRLREFAFLKPHSVIDHNLIFYTDVIIRIACSLTNLQSPIIKS